MTSDQIAVIITIIVSVIAAVWFAYKYLDREE